VPRIAEPVTDSIETRLARIEVRAESRDESLRLTRQANDRAIADLNSRLDKLDDCMDALAEKLGNAIVAAFEKATEQFASRETLTWWTSLLTKGLLWLVGLGLFAIATGHWPPHLD
jgi:uncharacterized coiled-coil protein SlyX